MINTAGAYILVLILSNSGGISTQEIANFESCKAAVIQLEAIRFVQGYCIAKDVLPE
jgi:hypothetical protein